MGKNIYTFDNIEIGTKTESVGRTITEADIVNFAGVSGDFNLLHTDAEYTKKTVLGERVAHGLLVMSIASGLFTRTEFNIKLAPSLIAFMGIKDWKFRLPVKIGDTIRVVVEVTDKVETKADRGRITQLRTILNQKDEVVQEGETILLVKK